VAKLPVTVVSVDGPTLGNYRVTVAYADFTTGNYIIPETMATIEAVTISALAMATLSETNISQVTAPHHKHRRYLPRP
jgi:hypothetical protein